jgi:DNA-binding CsgD family transcriptional regulator/PAS domain-containing protein
VTARKRRVVAVGPPRNRRGGAKAIGHLPALSQDRLFADAVGAIYAAATAPSLWPQTLESIAAVFGDVGANLFYIRADGSFGIVVTPSLAAAQADYDREWWRHDIGTQRAIERGYAEGVEAITDRHVVSEEEIRTHPFYTEFLIPHGLGWFAAVAITPDPRLVLAVTVQRSAAKPRFSDEELAVHSRLGRHAEAALRLSARLITAEMTNLAFGDALARLDVGVFMVDAAGRVIVANPTAEKLIGDALLISGGRLLARFEPERAALHQAIAAVIAADAQAIPAPLPVLVHGLGTDAYLVAYVLPVRTTTDHPFERALVNARAIVVVRRSVSAEPVDPTLVRDLLDVTLGEARVAALVGAGLQPKEAAEKLGIAEETARTVLKRVFAKTGVARQSDLAALLTRLVLR